MSDFKPESWSERYEALKFISQTQRTLREQRRGSQTKAFFTTLTFYAIIGAEKFTSKVTLPQTNRGTFLLVLWFLLIAIAVLSSIYIEGLHAANYVNRKLAEDAEHEISNALGLPGPKGAGRTLAKTRFWEMSLIFLFAFATGAVITWF